MDRLTAYYFRAHMYTCVPRQVREDMQWMADVGTDAVAVAVLEQDLAAAVENIALIASEAERAGMELVIVPSRWGSLVAGSPKVPSIFACRHPEAQVVFDDGRGSYTNWLGPIASVHHPATFEFFCESIDTLLSQHPVRGLVWDEPKNLDFRDHSAAALEALGPDAPLERHMDAAVEFLDRVGEHALSIEPTLRLSIFTYAHKRGHAVDAMMAMRNVRDVGCDGRPWGRDDPARVAGESGGQRVGERQEDDKRLLDEATRFIDAARAAGKCGYFLIENHNLSAWQIAVMNDCLPRVLSLGAEHVMYYYYPRSVEDADGAMAVIAKHLRAARG